MVLTFFFFHNFLQWISTFYSIHETTVRDYGIVFAVESDLSIFALPSVDYFPFFPSIYFLTVLNKQKVGTGIAHSPCYFYSNFSVHKREGQLSSSRTFAYRKYPHNFHYMAMYLFIFTNYPICSPQPVGALVHISIKTVCKSYLSDA